MGWRERERGCGRVRVVGERERVREERKVVCVYLYCAVKCQCTTRALRIAQ